MKVLAQPDYNTRCVKNAKENAQEHYGAQCPPCDSSCKENTKKATGEAFPAFSTGAVRENKTGKGRCDLLPMCALIRLSRHFEAGTEAHGERNWELGIPIHSFIDSALRHLFKYVDGMTDEDHLVAAAWNIMCAMWTEEKKPEMQDIPTRSGYTPQKRISKERCSCYRVEGDKSVCWGTKNQIECDCGGYKEYCTHYPEKRNE